MNDNKTVMHEKVLFFRVLCAGVAGIILFFILSNPGEAIRDILSPEVVSVADSQIISKLIKWIFLPLLILISVNLILAIRHVLYNRGIVLKTGCAVFLIMFILPAELVIALATGEIFFTLAFIPLMSGWYLTLLVNDARYLERMGIFPITESLEITESAEEESSTYTNPIPSKGIFYNTVHINGKKLVIWLKGMWRKGIKYVIQTICDMRRTKETRQAKLVFFLVLCAGLAGIIFCFICSDPGEFFRAYLSSEISDKISLVLKIVFIPFLFISSILLILALRSVLYENDDAPKIGCAVITLMIITPIELGIMLATNEPAYVLFFVPLMFGWFLVLLVNDTRRFDRIEPLPADVSTNRYKYTGTDTINTLAQTSVRNNWARFVIIVSIVLLALLRKLLANWTISEYSITYASELMLDLVHPALITVGFCSIFLYTKVRWLKWVGIRVVGFATFIYLMEFTYWTAKYLLLTYYHSTYFPNVLRFFASDYLLNLQYSIAPGLNALGYVILTLGLAILLHNDYICLLKRNTDTA